MEKIQFKDSFTHLGNSIDRLKELLDDKETKPNVLIDATIHRFEFVIELFWKNLKKILSFEKVEVSSPREALAKSYQFSLIDDEQSWLEMLDDRNSTSHEYNEEKAKEIFERIKLHFPVIESTYNNLKKKYEL